MMLCRFKRVQAFAIACQVILLFYGSGCTHVPLMSNTARVTSTLADLHIQLVLDNVARFHDNPDTIPSFAVANAGTVSVSDQAGVGVSPSYAPTLTTAQQGGGALPIFSLLLPFNAQRSLTENWSLAPVTDSDNLRRLRCAFRLLVQGKAATNYEFCENQMKEFFVGENVNLADSFPPRGWYATGGKSSVPENACYVGHHGKTYVWVTPDGMNALAIFTMGVLDLATGKLHSPQRTVVRKFKGTPTPENLIETELRVVEDDPEALEGIRRSRTWPADHRPDPMTMPFNPGLLMLPKN
jgi:hypothetical protein